MVNLRQRTPAKSKVTKRTSLRTSGDKPAKQFKQYEEISIDSSDGNEEEDIILEDDSEPESSSKLSSESDLLEGYASTSTTVISDQEENDEDGSESEDDKEIRRIIEKTEAETRNIPLTARQRSKLEGTGPSDIIEQTISTNNNEIALTDEQALKKSEKSRRRKLQRDAKIEETKRATIDRLLQKQKKTPVASAESDEKNEENNSDLITINKTIIQTGYIRFIENSDKSLIQFPDENTFQAAVSEMTRTPKVSSDSLCQVCQKGHSKYVHPRNNKLFCSSACYKLIK